MSILNRLVTSTIAFSLLLMSATSVNADETIFAVTDNQFLVSWQADAPGKVTSGVAISGLQQNEQILGIDIRPADGQIFAVGSSNRLYTLGSDGAATQIGPVFDIPLDGSSFGYDFNPTIDRSRVDTNTNNNYVVNPNNGAIVQVTDVFYPAGDPNAGVDPNVVHLAYTNSFDGATTTQLYGIDAGLDILTTQANSAGTLGTVGSLGIDITEVGGFDISGATGIAYAALLPGNSSESQFYTIDLSSGEATLVGGIGGGSVITALTVRAIPEPTSALALVGLACGIAVRRRR